MQDFEDILNIFVVLWAVIDPIGSIPIFMAVTKKYAQQDKNKIATNAALISAGVLLFFLVVGEIILKKMGVSLPAFQVSGGIILFLFALSMIFGESKTDEEMRIIDSKKDTAVFPLAMPSIASPGAILAVVLLTDNSRHSIANQAITAIIMLVIVFITWVLMIQSKHIYRYIGDSGASITSRIMGLILAAIAANNFLVGLKQFFNI